MNAAPRLWLRLFLPFALGYFFSYFLRNANAVIAHDLSGELGLSGADLGLLTGAYLAAFGLAQLPLGVLLDRYGPRRVEAALLLVAGAGCLLFSRGETLGLLVGARALIGLGVSACLMASFSTFARWFPAQRQASLNASVMIAGSLGALAATSPLALVNAGIGWRPTFAVMALIAVLIAALIYTTPERPLAGAKPQSLAAALAGTGAIFRSRVFWLFAPQGVLVVGGFMALQSLWAVPFMTEAQGFSQATAAERMLLSALGMLAGFATVALGSAQLLARGVRLESLLSASYVAGAVILGLITLGIDPGGTGWFLLGACYGLANLAYALLQKHFDLNLAGRVNTALNLMSFAGAFVVQWWYGLALDLMALGAADGALAHRLTLGALALLQLAGSFRFLSGMRRLSNEPCSSPR